MITPCIPGFCACSTSLPARLTAEASEGMSAEADCLSVFGSSCLAHARQLSAVAVHQALNLRLQRLSMRHGIR